MLSRIASVNAASRKASTHHGRVAERPLIDREVWTPPVARQATGAKHRADAAFNTVSAFAERYVTERGLRPTTARNYRQPLATRILPMFADMPLVVVTLSEINAWRASLDPTTPSTNAAAYRLLPPSSNSPRRKSWPSSPRRCRSG